MNKENLKCLIENLQLGVVLNEEQEELYYKILFNKKYKKELNIVNKSMKKFWKN